MALAAAASLACFSAEVAGQEVARPILQGTAYVGEDAMASGTVVLHHLSDDTEGELDSVAVEPDGRFAFPLPNVPDPARNDVFFASVRHDGVLYFGPAITAAMQLDSVYEVHAYDTLLAPSEGVAVPIESRSVFFEPDAGEWRVTDLFQLRNDQPRTIIAREGGIVWRHPLPAEARELESGEGEIAFDAVRFEGGDVVVRAALSPGERLFVVRYRVDSPVLSLPSRGAPEAVDILVREPAPPLEVRGLELRDRIELEAGSTYLRFTGVDYTAPTIDILATEESRPPRVEWAAALLALVLAGAGILVLRPPGRPRPAVASESREDLLLQVARLDESFDGDSANPADRKRYQRRRAELIRRIRETR